MVLLEAQSGGNDVHGNIVTRRQQRDRLPEIRTLAWRLTERALLDRMCEEGSAAAAAPRRLAPIRLHHHAAWESDLAVAERIDDFLRSCGDQMLLQQATLHLVQDPLVVISHGIAIDGVHF